MYLFIFTHCITFITVFIPPNNALALFFIVTSAFGKSNKPLFVTPIKHIVILKERQRERSRKTQKESLRESKKMLM